MPFLSTNTLDCLIRNGKCIENGDVNKLKHGAYELCLGNEYYITGGKRKNKKSLKENGQVTINAGQFALFITEEIINMPNDCLGLISFRNKFKSQGIVNVSGFHVDPGYRGRLKFSLFNAGGKSVTFQQGEKTFLIWFAKFDKENIPYGEKSENFEIGSKDLNNIHDETISLKSLDKRINKYEIWMPILITLIIGLIITMVPIFLGVK